MRQLGPSNCPGLSPTSLRGAVLRSEATENATKQSRSLSLAGLREARDCFVAFGAATPLQTAPRNDVIEGLHTSLAVRIVFL